MSQGRNDSRWNWDEIQTSGCPASLEECTRKVVVFCVITWWKFSHRNFVKLHGSGWTLILSSLSIMIIWGLDGCARWTGQSISLYFLYSRPKMKQKIQTREVERPANLSRTSLYVQKILLNRMVSYLQKITTVWSPATLDPQYCCSYLP